MLFDDTYKTIEKASEGLYKDKGSKFIAYAFPVFTEEEAREKIQDIKAQHPKARHHCWALRLTPDRSVFRINDDGEPSGTAGRPILHALLSADLTNILVVVVRYFGGTLLGVPGLIHAYKTASVEAIRAGLVIEKTINDIYQLEFDYLLMNEVMRVVKDENLEVISQDYNNECKLTVGIRKGILNKVLTKIENIRGVGSIYLYSV